MIYFHSIPGTILFYFFLYWNKIIGCFLVDNQKFDKFHQPDSCYDIWLPLLPLLCIFKIEIGNFFWKAFLRQLEDVRFSTSVGRPALIIFAKLLSINGALWSVEWKLISVVNSITSKMLSHCFLFHRFILQIPFCIYIMK